MAKSSNFMNLALKEAGVAFDQNEVPVGAVIVHDHQIIAASHNQNIMLNDATAHAEILAIRQACQQLNSSRLDDCDLYVTLEPCAMCAGAISLARIRRVYYGASDVKSGAIESGAQVFFHKQCHHKPEVYGGIAANESAEMMKKFFLQKRS